MNHMPSALSHQPWQHSRPAQCKCKGPWFERLTVGAEDAVDQIDLQRAETLERFRELDLEHAVEGGVLIRELGRRRRRLAALDALRLEIARLDAVLQRRLFQVP